MLPSTLAPFLGGAASGIVLILVSMVVIQRARKRHATSLVQQAEANVKTLLAKAAHEVEGLKSAAVLEGKMEAVQIREDVEREVRRRREEVERLEERLETREGKLAQRLDDATRQESEVRTRSRQLEEEQQALVAQRETVDRLLGEEESRLEQIAGLSRDDAKTELLKRVEDESRGVAAALARDIKEEARRGADREARRILSMTIQRMASEHTAESTVASVALPSDEMKGRIIGREGRNIRAFETATGVDVIIDDTPDTVVISCFDPIRREVARRALEALITDGRIQPGRIEEIVVKVRKELDAQLVELGEQAAYDLGVHGLHPELIKLVGRMRYRTSYGQNIYEHSKEVSWIAGMLAAELHLDVALARRGGLLHDVGKVLTHEHEGTHVELGVEVSRRYGEKPAVVNCIEAHHDDAPHESAESVLVQAADAISGARPGARREAFESYVKRLTNLENIANGFPGVEKTNVIQAGREVRVIVTPEKVTDDGAIELAETIAKRIEGELQYPGQIRVVVIRETRNVGIAR